MSGINSIQDESVRKVAQTLRSSGLAASDTEAIRMAESMVKTQRKIGENSASKNNQGINTQRPQAQVPNPTPKPEPVVQETKPSTEEEIPGTVENLNQNTVRSNYLEGVMLEDAIKDPNQETQENFVEPAKEEVSEEKQEEAQKIEEPVNEEEKEERQPPKKDLSEFKEASVDLSQVFKFK